MILLKKNQISDLSLRYVDLIVSCLNDQGPKSAEREEY